MDENNQNEFTSFPIHFQGNSDKEFYDRGFLKAEIRDFEGAIEDDTQAIQLNPQDHIAYSNRGNAKGAKGKLEEAILDYTEAIRLNPQSHEGYNNRGIAKQEKNDLAGAIEDFEASLKIKVHPEAKKALIDLLKQLFREEWKQKNWEETKSILIKLKKYLPEEDPQQKLLEQKIQEINEFLQTQESK